MSSIPTIAVIGGTGALGSGLAMRWAAAGYPVIIGSRSKEKAEQAARQMQSANSASMVSGDDNPGAARAAEIIVIAVPFSNHDATLEELKETLSGKIVIDAVVPLVPPKVSVVQLPTEGSAAQIAQRRLGSAVKVVSAYHNVGAAKLLSGEPIECDVLVSGDDKEAREAVIELTRKIGMRGIDAGPLANSVAAEALTSILIGINRRYKVDCAGIRITGIASEATV